MSDQWEVESDQLSHRGQERRHNEDYVGYFEPDQLDELAANGRLYLVADGVAKAAFGEVASQYAVKKILYDFYNSREPDLEARLVDVIKSANADIFERNNRQPEHREMATTLVAALIHGNELLVANVGDSRAYLVRDQGIEQISQDHSQVAQLVREGSISAAEAKSHRRRNFLLRSLGIDQRIKVDIFSRQLSPGDYIVLCSDGLTRYVSDDEIAQTVTKHPPKKAVRRLVELANARGGKDNISLSVTRILPTPVARASTIHRQRPELPEWDTLVEPGKKRQPVDWSRRRWLVYTGAVFLLGIGLGLAVLLALSLSQNDFDLPEEISSLVGAGATQTPEPANPRAPGNTPVVEEMPPFPSPNPNSIQTKAAAPSGTLDQPAASSPSVESPPLATITIEPSTPEDQSNTPLPPESTPACNPAAAFVTDLNVQDGQVFSPGQSFEKVWQIRNSGDCVWGEGFSLSFVDGSLMEAEEKVSITGVQPNAIVSITVPMTAPSASGTYTGTWRMQTPDSLFFGDPLWVSIKVAPPGPTPVASPELTILYDFVANASQAIWSAGDVTHTLNSAPIDRNLIVPPEGLVVTGETQLREGHNSPGNVLLTHPHQQLGLIQGPYVVTVPLQPGDYISATLGLPELASPNDDGVTFEVIFTPTDGSGLPETVVLTRTVTYAEGITSEVRPLTNVQPGQTGTFTLRARAGSSTYYDWALWIDLRLVRPQS